MVLAIKKKITGMGDGLHLESSPPLNALFFLASTYGLKWRSPDPPKAGLTVNLGRSSLFLIYKKHRPIKINTRILYSPRQISIKYELAHHQVKGPP